MAEPRPSSSPFLDTNVLLYLLSSDAAKADRAEALLERGVLLGVQVLNEFAAIARRKLNMPWDEVADVLGLIRQRGTVRPLTLRVHELALELAPRHLLSWYDALIVAAAVDAGCAMLFSEDMHDGLQVTSPIGGPTLTVRNPFKS
ncbi:MAG TPA: PIN domain-containing protein [Albitalea sp.]|uniref:PIN domain-containing protein n=1 Tax=Piscinibacter sp. TaxID=1903157 RepID=UPI002ED36333